MSLNQSSEQQIIATKGNFPDDLQETLFRQVLGVFYHSLKNWDYPHVIISKMQKWFEKNLSKYRPDQFYDRLKSRLEQDHGIQHHEYLLGIMTQYNLGIRCDLEKAFQYYQEGDSKGDTLCTVKMGVFFQNGYGEITSPQMAIEKFQAAADKGSPIGYWYLGWVYMDGIGVTADLRKSVKNFEKAASLKYAHAPIEIATLYSYGGTGGFLENYRKAFYWYLFTASSPDDFPEYEILATNAVADFYFSGRGVSKDVHSAIRWYRKLERRNFKIHGFGSIFRKS
ncbi:hypothetical protein G9A89_008244 [Geosiphon pyriformis]|nr:hypothetical protein G9A89_008244 [Geosiphon pyriformis]